MSYEVQNIIKWDEQWNEMRPRNSYLGDHPSNYYIVYLYNRDTNDMIQFNFNTLESKCKEKYPEGEGKEYMIHRSSHWAHGWEEMLLIRDDCDEDFIKDIDESTIAIAEHGVLDFEKWSEKEVDLKWEEVERFLEDDVRVESEYVSDKTKQFLYDHMTWDHYNGFQVSDYDYCMKTVMCQFVDTIKELMDSPDFKFEHHKIVFEDMMLSYDTEILEMVVEKHIDKMNSLALCELLDESFSPSQIHLLKSNMSEKAKANLRQLLD